VSRWASLVLVALALALTACDAPPSEAFGISLTSHGTVELRFGRCLGAWSVWVRFAGDDLSTRPVWALREDRGSGQAAGHFPPVIVVGGLTPKGWREVAELRHPLEPGVRYTVHVDSGESYQEDFDFTIDELKLDFTHELVPIEEFPSETACTTMSPTVAS
jgi:hypothetical protein